MLSRNELINKLKETPELNPDSYDGSYELMRATIGEYAQCGTDGLDARDLQLVYTMAIGTWAQPVDFKKKKIEESSLPPDSKERLTEVLDRIWADTEAGKYEKTDLGMFGTWSSKFQKEPTEEQVKRFIGLCIDLYHLPEGDDAASIDLTQTSLSSNINSFQAASASEVLHCLKPYVFPILNGMQGYENPFTFLGIELKDAGKLSTYAENVRAIKAFRDANFTFRNYKIIDSLAREIPPFDMDVVRTLIDDYKSRFEEVRNLPDSNSGEAFRWRALSNFKKKWDIDAPDFLAMLKEAFDKDVRGFFSFYNIYNMLVILTEHEPETMRNLFRELYSSSKGTKAKIEDFIQGCDELHARHINNAGDQSFQKSPAVTTYLFLYDPERNYPFRESAFDKLKEMTGFSCPKGRGVNKVEHYYRFANALCQAISEDAELCEMSDAWAARAELYSDESRHALTDEIIYFAYKWMDDATTDFSDWAPSLDEYDPGIDTEQWIDLLNNQEIATKDSLTALKCFRAFPDGATCTEVAAKYGRTANYYNAQITGFAHRVHERINCPMSERDEGGERRWSLPCLGKQAEKEQPGVFAWKLRPELYEALDGIDLSDIYQYAQTDEESAMKPNAGSNIILYGPPGTGKTYNVAAMAWLISQGQEASLEAIRSLSDADRASAKKWYDEQLADREDGQVVFTTFHQSYGYEEFIEGIRPVVDDADEDDRTGIRYDYEDGIFKSFCQRAMRPVSADPAEGFGFNSDPAVWKVSLAGTGPNEVREECLENNHIRIGWDAYGPTISDRTDFSIDGGKNEVTAFVSKMRKGDIVVSCFSSTNTDAIGVITGDAEWSGEYDYYNRVREVKWLAKDIDFDIVGEFELPVMTLSTVYRMKLNEADILHVLDKVNTEKSGATEPNTKPYIFVIDEINRGNISKIFGELITLIEPSKRIGQPDQQTAILPYTKKPFGIPSNVTIIGTMNTADRSIALMDTALRRRFKFIEMLPDYDALAGLGSIEGIDVATMVRRMNERIAVLYDREHTIGHAYFMTLAEQPTLNELASIIRGRIMPLLQEYFYDDYEKIRYVLADNQKKSEDAQFVLLDQVSSVESLFGSADNIVYGESKTFVINAEAFMNKDAYLGIYS